MTTNYYDYQSSQSGTSSNNSKRWYRKDSNCTVEHLQVDYSQCAKTIKRGEENTGVSGVGGN